MNEMDKKIYEYCKKVNWETEKISNFAKELQSYYFQFFPPLLN